MPLERALSKLGLASRTEARRLIEAGKVRVNGNLMVDPSRPIVPETARIAIDGVEREAAAKRTILLHKPRGVVTTRSDEKGRPTVYGTLGERERALMPVGRLDLATTGLLLLTSDTRLSDALLDPRNRIPRVYLVTVRGEFDESGARALTEGVKDEGEALRADQVEILKSSGRESLVKVRLLEGKNREIRRLFLSQGNEVTRLKRVSFGGLELGELAPGRWREVGPEELARAFPSIRIPI